MYSKFKKNASNGYKAVFEYTPSGENVDETKINVTMKDLNITKSVNEAFEELNKNSITSITYDGVEIKQSVTSLSVITASITKDGSSSSITPNDLTKNAGTYTITYSITFVYNGKTINKSINQTVVVQ